MPIIKSDFMGLYVAAGGAAARPLGDTKFQVGDEVKTCHFGGSTRAGVGKNPSCKRGQYVEDWTTTGYSVRELENRRTHSGEEITDEMIRSRVEWYLNGGPQQFAEELQRKHDALFGSGLD